MPSDSVDDDRPTRARRAAAKPKPDPDIWDDADDEDDDEPAPPRRTPARQRPRRRDAEVIPTPYVKWVVGGTLAALLFVGVVIGGAAVILRRPGPVGVNNPPAVAFTAARPAEPPADLEAVPEGRPARQPTAPPADLVAVPEGRPAANPFQPAPPPKPPEPDADPLPDFAWPTPAGNLTKLVKGDTIPAGGNAVEIAVAGGYLFARNSGTTVRAFDLKTKKLVGTAEAQHKFISISASPDGGALFAADYGGEHTGYGTATGIHRLHRFDTKTAKWESRPAPGVVGYLRAVAADRVVMTDLDQWVEMRLTLWEPGTDKLVNLGKSGGYRSGLIDYDPASQTVFHTGYELGSCKVSASALGAKRNAGPSRGSGILVVGHGGKRLYQGTDQFELADPTRGTNSFKDPIVAATRDLAIAANGNYYHAATAKRAGKLPFAPDGSDAKPADAPPSYQYGASASPVAVAPDGAAVWAYDPKADEFVRFDAVEPKPGDAAADATPEATQAKLPEFTWPAAPGAPGTQTKVTRATALRAAGAVTKIVATPDGKTLVALAGRTVSVFDTASGRGTPHTAVNRFFDTSLSPDGTVLYATDYSGDDAGWPKPGGKDLLQRYDVIHGEWAKPRPANKGALVVAASADDVLLLELNQSVELTFAHWGRDDLVAIKPSAGLRLGLYSGPMVYDPAARRLVHGTAGLSRQTLKSMKLTPAGVSAMLEAESRPDGEAPLTLSHGGERIYYGKRQIEATDITRVTNTFPAPIVAATRDLAFAADGSYYNAKTAKLVGKLPFKPATIAVDPSGTAVWAADPKGMVVKFTVSGN